MKTYEDVSDYLSPHLRTDEFRILLPLDGSEEAERSVAYLHALAPLGEIAVRFVSVIDPQREAPSSGDQEAHTQRQVHLIEGYLRTRVDELGREVASADSVVLIASPARAILQVAEEWNADLIVIRSHSRSGIDRWRLGSVADKVVRGAHCNVMVIGPTAATRPPEIRRVLVPLDGSRFSEEALPVARKIVDATGAVLHLIRVVEPPVMTGNGMEPGMFDNGLIEAMSDACDIYVRRLQAETGAVMAETPFGPAGLAIEEYVSSARIDLVVMTTHGRGGLVRSALGSVTDQLIRGAAPVLVVREPASERSDNSPPTTKGRSLWVR